MPLDPAYPVDRLAYMLEDAQPALFLGQQGLLEQLGAELPRLRLDSDAALFADQPDNNLAPLAGPDDLAYIMYTSGSTGKPKGTLVTNGSVVNLAWARIHGLYRRYTDQPMRTSFNYSFAFDSSVAELILLLDGHSLYLTPEEVRYDPEALARFFSAKPVCKPSSAPRRSSRPCSKVTAYAVAKCICHALCCLVVTRWMHNFGSVCHRLSAAASSTPTARPNAPSMRPVVRWTTSRHARSSDGRSPTCALTCSMLFSIRCRWVFRANCTSAEPA